jgi:DNA-binding GntR family transcriptional regulator
VAYTALQTDLARQIVELVMHQQLPVGTRLTELSLVQRLGVSRTPIRAALALLAERGVLAPHLSRGLVLAMASPQLAQLHFERQDDAALYERILQDRVEGRLPSRLSERDLLERYAVRRGTLNLTIARLQQEGVLRRRRGRGWEFEQALDSVDSERESYRLCLIHECAALVEPGFQRQPFHPQGRAGAEPPAPPERPGRLPAHQV